MPKDFWFQLNGDIITDAIEYEHSGYVKVTLEQTHLPAGINAGFYRLTDGEYVKDEALYAASDAVRLEQAREEGRAEIRAKVVEADALGSISGTARNKLKADGILP
jgi:hypothetical protein